jgi:hypothetical protein
MRAGNGSSFSQLFVASTSSNLLKAGRSLFTACSAFESSTVEKAQKFDDWECAGDHATDYRHGSERKRSIHGRGPTIDIARERG